MLENPSGDVDPVSVAQSMHHRCDPHQVPPVPRMPAVGDVAMTRRIGDHRFAVIGDKRPVLREAAQRRVAGRAATR